MSSEATTTNNKRKIAGISDTGTPPKVLAGDVQTMIFNIHNFENRTEKRADSFFTKAVECHAYQWKLRLYPRGDGESSDTTEMVSCYLSFDGEDNQKIEAKGKFRVSSQSRTLNKHEFSKSGTNWGFRDFFARSKLPNYLDSNGTLKIEVDLDIYVDKKPVWYPKTMTYVPFLSDLYEDESDESNTTFLLNGTEFSVHKVVLLKRARILYEMATDFSGAGPVPISGVNWATFDVLVRYMYTVLDFEDQNLWSSVDKAKTIFLAANRFGCTDLKLYAESVLVDKFLKVDTFALLFTMADSHSCALLKEAAMELYKKEPAAVSKTDGWKTMVAESPKLLGELLRFVACNDESHSDNDVETWDVTTLRERLQADNKDVDGSKEMLIQRCKALARIKI